MGITDWSHYHSLNFGSGYYYLVAQMVKNLPAMQETKGTFQAKMGSIKDRNGRDLTEAEDIKKRWQEYTEELHKKNIFMTQIITMV